MQEIAIVVPTHAERPDKREIISLEQAMKVFKDRPFVFVVPLHIDTTWYEEYCRGRVRVSFKRFKWKGLREYSKLMLSPEFYKVFLDYKYMLICHLDVFVFEDKLKEWCDQGYDYVGSVIFNPVWQRGEPWYRRVVGLRKAAAYPANGGLSLRKTASFYSNAVRFRKLINFMFNRREMFLEDIFWSYQMPRINPFFRIPSRQQALDFAIEYHEDYAGPLPDEAMKDGQPPMGCHGWLKYHLDFWQPYVEAHGYEL